ncbi:LURP-one-related/scramblase family protein [Corynebacterium tapiri]|uniref:Scramblase n=1 Tax=Corynebacterium tapiri TaxID=1448266 RepID=A0A5C4U4H5_9CORY|nr:phospholipid scramblase-related protein [Corynebacterium tapiri]TNL98552.1 hypothetical protein FHE74_04960 [Corynebacterium tapiri]
MSALLQHDVLVVQQMRHVFNDTFDILGPDGYPIGFVVGQGSALRRLAAGTRELSVHETTPDPAGGLGPGQRILTITDPFNFLRDTFEVHDDQGVLATITRRWSMFGNKLSIELPGYPAVEFRGDVFDFNAQIYVGEQVVATIDRQFSGVLNELAGKQRYVITFGQGLDLRLRAAILGAAIAADLIKSKDSRSS